MPSMYLLKLYSLIAGVFLILDLIWIGLIAAGFYEQQIGPLLRDQPLLGPALVFYAIYIVGIMVFAVLPGLEAGSLGRSIVLGAFLGLIAYGTFDLTSLALFKGFPLTVVVVDMIWGTVLTGSVAGAGFLLGRWIA